MKASAEIRQFESRSLVNIEAEASLLGAVLIQNTAYDEVKSIVSADMFSFRLHCDIWTAIAAKIEAGKTVNPVTLKSKFEDHPDIKQVGGTKFLLELTSTGEGLLALGELAHEIRELHARRVLKEGLSEALELSTNSSVDPDEAVGRVKEVLDRAAPSAGFSLPGEVDVRTWIGKKAPYREFLVNGWIANGSSTLLSGMEGVGKSLCGQQLATCAAMGIDFLGLECEEVNALYITCEDPVDELWRRQLDINNALGLDLEDLLGKLNLVSLKGEIGNELGTFDEYGRLHISPRYAQIEKLAKDKGARLVFIDNAAHVYPGNENDRHEVATFLSLLERLSEAVNGSVVLLAHPNKQHAQGNKTGNEYSGSTGWSAHVRSRIFIDYADKDDLGNPLGSDGRVLRKSKSNYGKSGEEIFFRWHEWAFMKDEDLPADERNRLAAEHVAALHNDIFVQCLKQRLSEKRAVSERPGPNYAPSQFERMEEAQGLDRESLARAMDRLFKAGQIETAYLYRDLERGRDVYSLQPTKESGL